jgi:hypothetical protein
LNRQLNLQLPDIDPDSTICRKRAPKVCPLFLVFIPQLAKLKFVKATVISSIGCTFALKRFYWYDREIFGSSAVLAVLPTRWWGFRALPLVLFSKIKCEIIPVDEN